MNCFALIAGLGYASAPAINASLKYVSARYGVKRADASGAVRPVFHEVRLDQLLNYSGQTVSSIIYHMEGFGIFDQALDSRMHCLTLRKYNTCDKITLGGSVKLVLGSKMIKDLASE